MAEHLHYVKDIFRFRVFHCSFPVSQHVEGDFVDSFVLEFSCDSFSSASKVSGKVSVRALEGFGFFSWQAV